MMVPMPCWDHMRHIEYREILFLQFTITGRNISTKHFQRLGYAWILARCHDKPAAPFYGSMLGSWQIMEHAILHRAWELNEILRIFVFEKLFGYIHASFDDIFFWRCIHVLFLDCVLPKHCNSGLWRLKGFSSQKYRLCTHCCRV